ncbi:hypothetical protein NIB78_03035 [Burkholderia multivorans]|uniref:hypothetical protein n=1 Tax=Burkholderia multivorans TaxID=87883 RepID=UPI002097E6B1|nr:hypothetical protein [Burkholderia multivorans]MCO7335484.1 hypothetical protein [Burkholderia multivorans]MCO7341091.1 hypothetical protein [Burkholderia multivorans]MCO7344731.1 hypothetical protein [Burkholderia multivorans]HDR9339128.1 hypothetical protein [Burkholderia multivorans]HDR9350301.1 hypothetical protein [Burkholderia multivorans]
MIERTIKQMCTERDVLAYTFAALCETQPEDARKIMARIEAVEAELSARAEKMRLIRIELDEAERE